MGCGAHYVLVCCLLASSVASGQGSQAGTPVPCGDKSSKVLGLTNSKRAENGLPPVCLNSRLMKAAQAQADWQASIQTMSHSGPGGNEVGDRVTAQRFRWRLVGENVAYGMTSARTVMHGWMASPGHRRNILSGNTHMGIAVDASGKFWAQVFATPMNPASHRTQCDVASAGGPLGSLYAVKPTANGLYSASGPQCSTGVCAQILQLINSVRAQYGRQPLCASGKLMVAAKALGEKMSLSSDDLQAETSKTGYSNMRLAMVKSAIWNSWGAVALEQVLKVFREKTIPGNLESLLDDHAHAGIASTGAGTNQEDWVLVLGSSYDPEVDRCSDGSAARVTPLPDGLIAIDDVPVASLPQQQWTGRGRVTAPTNSMWTTPASLPAAHSSGSRNNLRSSGWGFGRSSIGGTRWVRRGRSFFG